MFSETNIHTILSLGLAAIQDWLSEIDELHAETLI